MIYKFTVRWRSPDSSNAADTLGLSDLQTFRAYYLESETQLDDALQQALAAALADPLLQEVEQDADWETGQMVEVAYKRSIVDNENDSLIELGRLLGAPIVAGKVATGYRSSDPKLSETIRRRACNPNIEEVHDQPPQYETLRPSGAHQPMQTWDLRTMDDSQLAELGKADGRNLDLRQMKHVLRIQEETQTEYVSDVLLEALDARWSDHCSHATWRSLGNLLGILKRTARQTQNPNIISMFDDNAGVWDFYDGYCLAFKAETHNGPSAISAYFGQLTKLGGVLRDILGVGLGADPIGVFEYTATGPMSSPSPLAGRPSPRQIANETIRAIKEYGNTFGVPMMWSHMTQHPLYRAKPFALGGCIGLIPKAAAQRGQPQAGDLAMLIGGLTGNDGIHGASASSAGSAMDSAAVQIGSPLEQVKFRQAIMDLRDAGCLRAVTDLGAAGINSAFGEMGEGCGVWLNTALAPLKTQSLPAWRILLSESQERMALAVKPEQLEAARQILLRHRVRHAVLGKFTGDQHYRVIHDPAFSEQDVIACDASQMPQSGEVALNAPYTLLDDEVPPREPQPLPPAPPRPTAWPSAPPSPGSQILEKLLADPELADQRGAAGEQYDSTVQGITYYGPYYGKKRPTPSSYWVCRPLPDKPYGAVFSASFHPWLFEANPMQAARQCFLNALTGQVLAGVQLQDICLCDNFYTPHLSAGWDHWLVEMVRELGRLVETFNTPLISGKDSSAGSTRTDEGVISVPPAVFISALGKIPDVGKLLPNAWRNAGNLLVRIGPDCVSSAGTLAERVLLSSPADDVDEVSPQDHLKFLQALESSREFLQSGVPLGVGGTLGKAALGVLANGLGAALKTPNGWADLLQEHRCGALVEVAPRDFEKLPAALKPQVVGEITDQADSLTVDGEAWLTSAAIAAWGTSYAASLQASTGESS